MSRSSHRKGHQKRHRKNAPRARATNGDTDVGYWVVAFLDILGYRSVLAGMDISPGDLVGQDAGHAQKAFIRAVNLRRRFVGQLREFLRRDNEHAIPAEIRALPGHVHKEYLRFRGAEILNTPGPDHVVLACSLTSGESHFPVRGVYDVVSATAAAMLIQLALGGDDPEGTLPLRGGIDVALGGLMMPERFLFSPALTKAYDLESKCAVSPRAIAGDQFWAYLTEQIQEADGSNAAQLSKQFALRVKRLFFLDSDGKMAVDFFGPVFREQLPADLAANLGGEAWKFVRAANQHVQTTADERVRRKYEWLLEYMKPRLSLWDVKN